MSPISEHKRVYTCDPTVVLLLSWCIVSLGIDVLNQQPATVDIISQGKIFSLILAK